MLLALPQKPVERAPSVRHVAVLRDARRTVAGRLQDAGVFDAADVGRGPVAVASKPGMHVPFLLHAAWMATPVTATPGPTNTFADELDRVGELPDDLADVVLEVARELEEGVPLG